MRSLRLAASVLVIAAFVGAGVIPVHADPRRQNVVLILTDDQRWDSLEYMPNVESLLVARGVTFTNAFDNNPLCCPTRSTIMTGLTSGHNGVWGNINGPDGGFRGFVRNGDQSRQVFGWLHDAGYTTSLIGKFLNGYDLADHAWVLNGVDDWQAFLIDHTQPAKTQCRADGYFATCYSNDGTLELHGEDEYSTTTSGEKAVDFIWSAPAEQPLFLYYAPRAPHGPTLAEAKYHDACAGVPPVRPPSYNRSVGNGPQYMTVLKKMGAHARAALDHDWLRACQTLLSVDDQVGAIVQALSDTGRLGDTLIMFASDNGFLFGEHRWNGKTVPYDESIRVPVVVRDDAVIPPSLQGTSVADQITSLDDTPTFLEAAGLSRNLDGQSLFPLLQGGAHAAEWVPQDDVLIEHGQYIPNRKGKPRVPAYCGVRTPEWMYAVYQTGEEELYDLVSDRWELHNVASSNATELAALRQKTEQLCDPPPPEFGPWP